MERWNFATVWEAIAQCQPERPAIVQGGRTVSWREFNAAANAIARHLVERGLGRQAKVGVFMRNRPEYLQCWFAAYKAGLVPFNINFRYGSEELGYLLENADAQAVVFDAEFAETVDRVRMQSQQVRCWIAAERDGAVTPDWADDFGALTAAPGQPSDFVADWGRSPDDIMLLYTGGTTGMPKGVMWPQDLAFRANGGGGSVIDALPAMASLKEGIARLAQNGPPASRLICPPLMHGAGISPSQGTLSAGGCVFLLQGRGFDAVEAWDDVDRHRIAGINIVGGAFAFPLAEALAAHPGRWDLSCVSAFFSSGAMFDAATREALLASCPNARIIDKLGASEISSLAEAITYPGEVMETATFRPTAGFALISFDGEILEPKPGAHGLVASSNLVPLGYYKDPEKTAETFRTIVGVRYGVPGDYAEIDAAGNLRLLGRDSQCINTGGEKVFAEEVEEALKSHADVRDAAVIGLPDPRFGAKVFAVVELARGELDEAALIAHAGTRLARYKLPRGVMAVASIERLANGKVDYKRIRQLVEAASAAD